MTLHLRYINRNDIALAIYKSQWLLQLRYTNRNDMNNCDIQMCHVPTLLFINNIKSMHKTIKYTLNYNENKVVYIL